MFYLFIYHAKCMPQCISVLEKGFVLLCFFVFRFHFHLSRYFVNIFKLTELCISYLNSLTLCSLLHYLVPIFSQLQTIYSITLTIVIDICTLHSFEISLQQYIRSFMWFWNVLWFSTSAPLECSCVNCEVTVHEWNVSRLKILCRCLSTPRLYL